MEWSGGVRWSVLRRVLPAVLVLVLPPGGPALAWGADEGRARAGAGASAWVPLADLRAAAKRWAPVEETLGPGWRARFHPLTGSPEWILGPGLALGRPVGTDDGSIALARSLVERMHDALCVSEMTDLVLDRAVAVWNPHGHEIVTIQFRQTWRGRDVRLPSSSARVHLTFNGTLGRLAAVGSEAVADLRVEGGEPLPAGDAVAAALARLSPLGAVSPAQVLRVETYVYARRAGEALAASLVHEVQVQTDHPARLHVMILDAATLDLIEWRDDLRTTDVTGSVSAGTWDDDPQTGAFNVRSMRSLRVDVTGGGSGTTDTAGGFLIPHGGTAPVTITGRFLGTWAAVTDGSGNGNLSFSSGATPGVPAAVVLNPTNASQYETAEATAYRFTTASRFFVQARYPSFNGLAALATNVNLNNTCNAYWNGSSINFFRSGGGCNNTAYEDVVAHEYGHGFHQWFHGSTNPGGFSEGIGDHLGIYLSSRDDAGNAVATQRVIGRSFFTSGGVVRDYRPGGGANNTQWPCPGCGVHKAGEVWGGFVADLRDNLVATQGLAAAAEIAENITIAQYALNPTDMPDGVNGAFLLDDDDGNLSNGTPRFAEIAAAADRHGLPRPPDPQNVSFSHRVLPWTLDTANGCEARVVATSTAGAVTAVQLRYRVNGGGEQSVGTTSTGAAGEFAGVIPAQAAGARVAYRFTGQDAAGGGGSSPWYEFSVARPGFQYAQDFESGAAGWTVSGSPARGQWEWGDPEGTIYNGVTMQSEDDHTPGGGVNCFSTGRPAGANASAHDLDGGPAWLTSPALNLAGAASATLTFWYWFQLAGPYNDTFRLEVSNNNGGSWATAFTQTIPSPSWRSVTLQLESLLPLTGQMRLRFSDADEPNDSINEAAVDDIVISAADTAGALSPGSPTPAIGSVLNLALSVPGLPGGAWFLGVSLTTGPTYASGVGTIDLGHPVHLLGAGFLDGAGGTSLPVAIPMQPNLVGLTVHAQAFIRGTPDFITNRASVTFRAP